MHTERESLSKQTDSIFRLLLIFVALSLSLSLCNLPSLHTLLACDIMMWGWRHGKGKLHPLLHGFRSLASRIPSQDSIFLHHKGGNFSGFSSFSSISQSQKPQGKRNVVQVNKRFHNAFLAGKRFYCVYPPHPDNAPPRGLIDFYKWYFDKFETVPYTKRTRFIQPTIAQERIGGEKQFEELKVAFESEGKVLPPTHPDCVRVTIIFHNIIDALQRGLKKMENVSSSQEHTTMLHRIIWMRLLRRSKPPFTLHLEGLNWEVLVVDYPDNASQCYPGGKIVVSTALLHHFGSDAEIAHTIGHEVAHVVARHSAERFTRTPLWILCIHYILNQFVTIDFAKTIIPRLPFNRRFEMEADYIGLLLMASAGYDPQLVPKIFEKMGKSEDTDNDSMLGGYLSTHPSGIKRAKALARAKIMKEALVLYKDVRAERGVE